MIKNVPYLTFVTIGLCILPLCPLLWIFFDINTNILFTLISAITVIIIYSPPFSKGFTATQLVIVFLIIISSLFASLYWSDSRYLFLPALYLPSILIASKIDRAKAINLVETLSRISLMLIIGGIFASVYVMLYKQAVFEALMKDGRPLYFFPFSLSNVLIGAFTRPSGIFDEPGAFSFFICSVIVLRELYSRSRKLSWILLLGGLVTLSLAHLVFLIFYSLHCMNKTSLGVLICVAAFVLILQSPFNNDNDELSLLIYDRISFNESTFLENNRAIPLMNSINLLRQENIVFGLDPSCLFDREVCYQQFGYIGENIFSPVLFGGLAMSLPFYISIFFLIKLSFKYKNYFLIMGFVALLAQRPYALNLGYSMIYFLIFYYFINARRVSSCGVHSDKNVQSHSTFRNLT